MIDKTFAQLEALEVELGAKLVRDACKRYLRKKTLAGILPTKRKPMKREWVLEAYDSQDGVCPRCHELMMVKDASGDHIVPLDKGGKHERRNIQAVHFRNGGANHDKNCNSSKGANDWYRESKLAQTGRAR